MDAASFFILSPVRFLAGLTAAMGRWGSGEVSNIEVREGEIGGESMKLPPKLPMKFFGIGGEVRDPASVAGFETKFGRNRGIARVEFSIICMLLAQRFPKSGPITTSHRRSLIRRTGEW